MSRSRRSIISKKIRHFAQIRICVVFLRYAFLFYSFISFVFWLLNCFEVDWLYLFNWLFVIPFKFIRNFYTPEGVSVDFTLAIIGGLFLILGFICDLAKNAILQMIYDLEYEEQNLVALQQVKLKKTNHSKNLQEKEKENQTAKVKEKEKQNLSLEEIEAPRLLFLISPTIKKFQDYKTSEFTFQEIETIKQDINKILLKNFLYSKPTQKGYYRKNLFLIYNDFNYVDEFLNYIRPTIETVSAEFAHENIKVSFYTVLGAVSSMSNLEKELDCMDIIISLKFQEQIIFTSRFNSVYENKAIKSFSIKCKGEYNLSKNLTIVNKQPIYVLDDKTEKVV